MSVGRLPVQETEEIPSRCGLLLPSFLCSPVRSADMQMYVNATLQKHQLGIEEKNPAKCPLEMACFNVDIAFYRDECNERSAVRKKSFLRKSGLE